MIQNNSFVAVFLLFILVGICVPLKVFTSSSEVTALQNSDVLLPCYFTPSRGLTYILVTWTFDGLTLSQFKFGQLENQDKAMMLESELQKYNASLLLKNVTFKDSGEYTCKVIETMLETETVRVSFKVYTPLKIFLKPSRIMRDQPTTVECHVQDFYPDDPTIEWVIDAETLSQHGPLELKTNEDNTSSAMSQYHYYPSTKDVVPNISCRVKHESLKGASMEIQLLICKPNFTTKSVMKGEKWHVICKIDGCPFKNDTLRVKSKNSILNESKCSEGTVCATEATFRKNNKDDKDKEELVCEMEFEGIVEKKPILFTDQDATSSIGEIIGIVFGSMAVIVIVLVFVFYKKNLLCFFRVPNHSNSLQLQEVVPIGNGCNIQSNVQRNQLSEPSSQMNINVEEEHAKLLNGNQTASIQNTENGELEIKH